MLEPASLLPAGQTDLAAITRRHFQAAAATYDRGRSYEQWGFGAQELARLGRLTPADPVLDLGCGTGAFLLAYAEEMAVHGGRPALCGLDPSAEMLAQARAKPGAAAIGWVQGQGEALPWPEGTFQAVFTSQAWHHLADQPAAARACLRVLRPGGVLLVKTFSHAQWRAKPVFRFFPEMLASQLARYPDEPELKAQLRAAGFADVSAAEHNWEDAMRPSEYVRAAEERWHSMFSHLTAAELQAGIARLRRHIETAGDAPLRNDDVNLVVAGYKP